MKCRSVVSLTTLLIIFTGTEALILTQEKALHVNLGGNVNIPCIVSDTTQPWSISWFQQKADGSMSFLLVDGTRTPGLPARFTYSETGSGYNEYLHINGMQAEDMAVYYCACIGGCGVASNSATFGKGTEVTVARPPSPPSLVLMAPAQPPLPGASTTLLCLAEGYHPDGATLSWSENGASVTGSEVQTGQSQRQPDGTYSLSSLLTLTSTRWHTGHTFSCHLGHSALSSPVSKSVSEQQCSP